MTEGGAATVETMRQLRVALRLAMRAMSTQQAAAKCEVHENTLQRILRGKDVRLSTAARIFERLGVRLEIHYDPPQKDNML